MRKSRFTEAQSNAILKEAEGGVKVAILSWQNVISVQVVHNWRGNTAGSSPAKGLCKLEDYKGVPLNDIFSAEIYQLV